MADITENKSLESSLYSAADALRSKMDANEYKNYLLGIIFYWKRSKQRLLAISDKYAS